MLLFKIFSHIISSPYIFFGNMHLLSDICIISNLHRTGFVLFMLAVGALERLVGPPKFKIVLLLTQLGVMPML